IAEMAHTRNSENNAPATAAVGSSVAQGRAKKEQVPQSRLATVPAQVVMPSKMGEAFNLLRELWRCLQHSWRIRGRGEIRLHHCHASSLHPRCNT
ncbi:hypothetical protein HAX54_010002, partial [Datura stramonium]|nr:hypothetical protein [Datura stramonium]